MPNPVIFWELGAKDAQKLCAFYAHLFEWEIEVQGENYHALHSGGGGINGAVLASNDIKTRRPVLYALVDNLHKYLFRAVELGGRVITPIHQTSESASSAMFQDVEGNWFGLLRGDAPDSQP